MPKKQTKLLMIIILLIDAISIWFFVYLFNFTQNLITETVEKEREIVTELKRSDTKILMKSDMNIGKMYQDKLMGYIVPSEGTIDFIKSLEQVISNSGVKADIKTVTNETFDKGNSIGLELIRVSLDITGEWNSIKFFLTSLENYPLKIDIKKISLNKFSENITKGKTVPLWSGSIEFTVVKVKDVK